MCWPPGSYENGYRNLHSCIKYQVAWSFPEGRERVKWNIFSSSPLQNRKYSVLDQAFLGEKIFSYHNSQVNWGLNTKAHLGMCRRGNIKVLSNSFVPRRRLAGGKMCTGLPTMLPALVQPWRGDRRGVCWRWGQDLVLILYPKPVLGQPREIQGCLCLHHQLRWHRFMQPHWVCSGSSWGKGKS